MNASPESIGRTGATFRLPSRSTVNVKMSSPLAVVQSRARRFLATV